MLLFSYSVLNRTQFHSSVFIATRRTQGPEIEIIIMIRQLSFENCADPSETIKPKKNPEKQRQNFFSVHSI